MNSPDADLRTPIDLSAQPPFRLGALEIRPSTRQVRADDGAEQIAEPRVLQVLVALASVGGAVVSRDTLVARCWEGRIVGEDAINRAIAKTRQLADLTQPPAFVIETIPRVGYRIRTDPPPAPHEGSPAAANAAPTPNPAGAAAPAVDEGPQSQLERSPAWTVGQGSRRRMAIWAGGGAILLIASLAAALWWLGLAQGRVMAVEPLKAVAGDAAAQSVRLGLAGELARALGRNRAGVAVEEVGDPGVRSGRAALVLSGDVATIGDRLQAHVQIRNARSGAILWANDFVGDPSHPDIVREQIATTADGVINCALSARYGGKSAIGDEANRLYLTGCDFVEQYRLDEALQPFRQVVALEPGFARAWADLATTEVFTNNNADPARRAAAYGEAAAHARRALAIDPNTDLAYFALAETMPGIRNWQQRVDIIARGLKVEPGGSELNNGMAQELERVGRTREAITYYRRSMAADPLGPVKTASLFAALAADGQLDEAERLIDRALQLWPRNAVIWNEAFLVELQTGDPNRAEAMLAAPDRPGLRDAGEVEQARQWLRVRRDPTPMNTATVTAVLLTEASAHPREDQLPAAVHLAELGQIDAAYRLALEPGRVMDEDNDSLLFRSDLSRFQSDPRFMALAASRGLVPIWQATHAWPDFCAGTSQRAGC